MSSVARRSARLAAAIQRARIEDAALLQRINAAVVELHRLWSGIDPPTDAERADRIAALEREIDGLYAQRRHLATRAKAEALNSPADTPG